MLLIDKYAYNNNLVNINPSIKMYITIIFLIASMTISNIYVLLTIICVMSFFILYIAEIKLDNYINMLKIPMIFLITGTIATIINISPDNNNLVFSINIRDLYIGLSSNAMLDSIYLIFRAIACLTCVYFFMITTPFNQIIILLKKFHTPDSVIEITMLMYRFIFIFLDEVSEIRIAQELKFGYINITKSYQSTGLLMKNLFNRLMIRYNDMYIALDMKLYSGKFYIVEDDNV